MNRDPYRTTRRLIWFYFFLLLIEGAIRKWWLPSLANPLLIIRDPVVILIYISALMDGSLEVKNGWILVITILGIATFCCGFLAQRVHLGAMLYGFRTNFLHLPLIFVIAKALTIEDVRWLGKWVLIISIPMAVLMAAQFRVGSGHWLNAAVGKDRVQLESALGKVRASGTFSFITGPVSFYAMVAAYLLYGQVQRRAYSLALVAISTVALILAAVSSGSRSLFATVMITGVAFFIGLILHPPSMARAFRVILIGGFAYLAVNLFDIFHEASQVMSKRVELATSGSLKGFQGYVQRISGMFFVPISSVPIFGRGFGLGTNAGAAMIGVRGRFYLAENEWQRIGMESGPILGLSFILLRLALTSSIAVQTVRAARKGNLLPAVMFGAAAPTLVIGQFGQPTILGFGAFVGGCCLAALNDPSVEPVERDAGPQQPRRRAYATDVSSAVANRSPAGPRPGFARPAPQPGRWTVRPTANNGHGNE